MQTLNGTCAYFYTVQSYLSRDANPEILQSKCKWNNMFVHLEDPKRQHIDINVKDHKNIETSYLEN